MRALFLTPHYPPDVAATGQLIEELVEDWVAAGHEALVVTAEPSYVKQGGARRLAPLRREERAGAELLWLNLPTLGRRGRWSRLLPFGAFFAASFVAALTTKRPDVVFAMSTPPLMSAVVAAVLRRLRGVPFVYNLQDVYPDIAIELGVMRDGALARGLRRVEQGLRERAAVLTVVGEDMRRRIGADLARVEVIPNWTDPAQVTVLQPKTSTFRVAHDLEETFIALYSGNLGRAHGAEVLPEVAAHLKEHADVRLVVIGEGPARAAVERAVIERGLDNLRLFPYQPKSALADSLGAADVSLILQKRGTAGLVVPSKLYGILASGRAIVAAVPADSDVAQVVRDHDLGVVVEPESAAAIADGILELRADPHRLRAAGVRARQLLETRYCRRVVTARYVQLLARVAESGAAP